MCRYTVRSCDIMLNHERSAQSEVKFLIVTFALPRSSWSSMISHDRTVYQNFMNTIVSRLCKFLATVVIQLHCLQRLRNVALVSPLHSALSFVVRFLVSISTMFSLHFARRIPNFSIFWWRPSVLLEGESTGSSSLNLLTKIGHFLAKLQDFLGSWY